MSHHCLQYHYAATASLMNATVAHLACQNIKRLIHPTVISMILSDIEIHNLIQHHAMVQNHLPELVNPASLDVRLGNLIMIESAEGLDMKPFIIADTTQTKPYMLKPGQFILAQTIEIFNMPESIAGLFFLKSSRAREGYENLHAGYADPGWHGSSLTLELKNSRQIQSLPLWPGLKIGQMVFFKMSCKPAISYATIGHYNDDLTTTASKQIGC
jgi:dCTP deaminase